MAQTNIIAIRRVPVRPPRPVSIDLVPGWRVRAARLWRGMFLAIKAQAERLTRATADADKAALQTPTRREFADSDLSSLSPHVLADIGAPEEVRARAERAHDDHRRELRDLEHGHRVLWSAHW